VLASGLLGRGGDVSEGSEGVRLTDEQRIDWPFLSIDISIESAVMLR
jgi:hypothetical protein